MHQPPSAAALTTANSIAAVAPSYFARNAIKARGRARLRQENAHFADPKLTEFIQATISANVDDSNDAGTPGKSFLAVVKKAQRELGLSYDEAWAYAQGERPDLYAQMAA
jgi:hypothetical protein